MALTKEQFDQLGLSLYHQDAGPGYQDNYLAADTNTGIVHQLDASTAQYLQSLGVGVTTDDRSATGALSGYSTFGGNTVNDSYLSNAYNTYQSKQQQTVADQNTQLGNAAIASGNTADVEKYFPGYTLWNGAFVQKSTVPTLQANGSTVQGGNVVGPAPSVPAGSPGAALQAGLANGTVSPTNPQQQMQASTSVPAPAGTTPVAPGSPVQPPQGSTTQPNPTDATLGANPTQVGGKFGTQQFGRIGNDVYEIMSDGSRRQVSEAEFSQKLKAQGLNLDVLPQLPPDTSSLHNGSGGNTGTGLAGATGVSSPNDFVGLYQGIFKELGLSDIKTEFEKTQKEYQDLATELSDKIVDVNHNPWLTEGIRIAEGNKLKEKYQARLDILTNKQTIYDSLYKQGVQQAQFLATGEYNQSQDAALLAEKQLEAQQKLVGIDPSTYKEVQGGLFDLNTGKWIVPPAPNGGHTPTEGDKQAYEASQIQNTLDASRKGGEYVDGNVYLQQRALSRMSPSEFDGRYAQLLSSSDRSKYNIGSASTVKSSRLQELLIKSNNGENLDALSPAELAELNSLL